jgi:hypothetical protein
VSHSAIYLVSGWDERFRGRGWEDYAFSAKCTLYLNSVNEFQYDALHLYHPCETNSTREINESLDDDYSRYVPDNYANHIKLQAETFGSIHKYSNNLAQKGEFASKLDFDTFEARHERAAAIYVDYYNTIKTKHLTDFKKLIYSSLCSQHNCDNCPDLPYDPTFTTPKCDPTPKHIQKCPDPPQSTPCFTPPQTPCKTPIHITPCKTPPQTPCFTPIHNTPCLTPITPELVQNLNVIAVKNKFQFVIKPTLTVKTPKERDDNIDIIPDTFVENCNKCEKKQEFDNCDKDQISDVTICYPTLDTDQNVEVVYTPQDSPCKPCKPCDPSIPIVQCDPPCYRCVQKVD